MFAAALFVLLPQQPSKPLQHPLLLEVTHPTTKQRHVLSLRWEDSAPALVDHTARTFCEQVFAGYNGTFIECPEDDHEALVFRLQRLHERPRKATKLASLVTTNGSWHRLTDCLRVNDGRAMFALWGQDGCATSTNRSGDAGYMCLQKLIDEFSKSHSCLAVGISAETLHGHMTEHLLVVANLLPTQTLYCIVLYLFTVGKKITNSNSERH